MSGLFNCRLLFWGPICALLVIKCITFTTLYLTSMWLPFNKSLIGFFNYFIFFVVVGSTLYNFFCAIFVGPGYVPSNWSPKNIIDTRFLQKCQICESFKCPRAHHCRKCQRCILKMDHHCPWINNCVGHFNQLYFTLFLFFSILGSIQSAILLSLSVYRAYNVNWYFFHEGPEKVVILSFVSFFFCLFSIGLTIGVIIAVGCLFFVQIKNTLRNQTSIEEWIVAKAKTRKDFVYPYNLGHWKNFKQLFAKHLNGIWWPVLPNCDQYTLTREQLIQKIEKKFRSRFYKVIKEYNGAWFPIFSQDLYTCVKYPFSDEPRIKLNIDDIINVTRWKNYWLYGEKVSMSLGELPKIKPKGWFPKRCVVEIIEKFHSNVPCNKNETVKKNS